MSTLYFPSNPKQNNPNTPAQPDQLKEQMEYTDEDLEGYIPYSNESSYYEKAQDFRKVIKILRIHYLGLRPIQKKDDEGNTYTVYVKQSDYISGINDKGISACVRFLETRLGQHMVLTKWDKERMFLVMLDDMMTWNYYMLENMEEFNLETATWAELRALLNDLLEATYGRAVGGEERRDFRPFSSELKRLLGANDNSEAPKQNYPNMQPSADMGNKY